MYAWLCVFRDATNAKIHFRSQDIESIKGIVATRDAIMQSDAIINKDIL